MWKYMWILVNLILIWLVVLDIIIMLFYLLFVMYFYCIYFVDVNKFMEKNSEGWMLYMIFYINLVVIIYMVLIWLCVMFVIVCYLYI